MRAGWLLAGGNRGSCGKAHTGVTRRATFLFRRPISQGLRTRKHQVGRIESNLRHRLAADEPQNENRIRLRNLQGELHRLRSLNRASHTEGLPLVYEVDSLDRVVELHDAPRPDIGAPLPLLLSDEHRLLLAYRVSEPDPEWDGSYVTVVSQESEGSVACVRFKGPSAHMFGPPNDEAFRGHPLANRG
jgi:hypothetical protein